MLQYLPYSSTGYFSKTVNDYLSESAALRRFYRHEVSYNGVKEAMTSREYFPTDRDMLTEVLEEQYRHLQPQARVRENIALLKERNTFTITTAHQPNLFTGPLYFIYKIIHTIKIAADLKLQFPANNFVPVYYMGSEDADLDELNHIEIDGKKYAWSTTQTGAVGRMLVDDELIRLIQEVHGQLGVNPFGNEWIDVLNRAYTKGKSIQQATFELVHELFAGYGLIVLIPDNARLKKVFEPVVEKELLEQFSHQAVKKTAEALNDAGYKIQASGREINLFYLLGDKRERIEQLKDQYVVKNMGITFSKEAILQELYSYPERFSANVVLRGVFQEIILPNIIFVGGGGELAYWLELRGVFDKVGAPYPMLILRNSFLLLNEKQQCIIDKLQLGPEDLFKENFEILNLILQHKGQAISLSSEIEELEFFYNHLREKTAQADPTLAQHVQALGRQAGRKLAALQKKIDSAQRKRLDAETRQLTKLKGQLFPHNSLQERVENFGSIYSVYGKSVLDTLLTASKTLDSAFCLLTLTNN